MLKYFIFCFYLLLLVSTQAAASSKLSIEELMLRGKFGQSESKVLTSKQVDAPIVAQPFRFLIDVRSNHSDGAHDFQTLIALAKQRHIDVLSFNEHDRFTIRLGVEPFPSLLGYSQEHPSLYQTGLETFFQDLERAQATTNIQLMAGTESTPGYYWQGIPLVNLSLHDAERHLITLNISQPSQINGLSSYHLENAYGSVFVSFIFWGLFACVGLFLLYRSKHKLGFLMLTMALGGTIFVMLMNPEHKDENFIRSAQSQGLFTIWAHPGTLSGVRDGPMGVQLNTPPYNKYIFKHPADAFAAVYGDTDQNTLPGGLWDRYMMNYLRGYVAKPMWAVAAGDYHEEGMANEYLGNFPMDIWAKSTSQADILTALKQGRMTSWHMGKDQNLSVHTLSLSAIDPTSKQTVSMLAGDKATVLSNIQLLIGIKELGQNQPIKNLSGQWIIDGKILEKVSIPVSATQAVQTQANLPKGKHVIRFQIPSQHGIRLETNPFLVEVR